MRYQGATVISARTAVTAVFVINGALYGSWAARVPTLATQVGAGSVGVGLALLGPAVAMVLTASPAARACAAWGARRVIMTAAVGACLALPALGLTDSVLGLGLSLAILGGFMGTVDVSMNIAGAAVVHRLERPLMPVFHAGYSFGGLLGSAAAAGAAEAGLPLAHHFGIVGLIGVVTVLVIGRSLPGDRPAPQESAATSVREMVFRRRLWLLAGVALCAAVAEGTCAEWSALFLTVDRGMSEPAAATAYAAFSLAIASARLLGERVERTFGPYRVLVGSGMLAGAGLTVAVTIPIGALAYIGFTTAGIGLAYCFPVAMDLAAADGRFAGTGGEREVGFVTTVAYGGNLAGPPMIGALAALSTVTVAIGVAGLLSAVIVPCALAIRRVPAQAEQREARVFS